ncbi:MAG TPA: DUF5615 family PIN-like protein [Chloroflexia bacterium]|nr:DUF5615 family PIN-like protein [Chloroflexia bacterium]
MTIRFYLDEDTMDKALVQALKVAGIDVTTTEEAGLRGCTDEEQLRFAASEQRVLYSFNVRDFYILHTTFLTQGLVHAGIILGAQKSYSVGEQMRRLSKLAASRSVEEMRDRLEFLSEWGELA